MLQVLFAVVFTAMQGTRILVYAPDVAKAKLATLSIFDLLDRKSRIDYTSTTGQKPPSPQGIVSCKKLEFTYPSRPEVPVLQGMDISANKGQVVAIVGPSGSGKSTVVGLLGELSNV